MNPFERYHSVTVLFKPPVYLWASSKSWGFDAGSVMNRYWEDTAKFGKYSTVGSLEPLADPVFSAS